jgi:hypothetical protein
MAILRPLQVVSHREKFDAWVLYLSEDEKNIIAVVQDGLKSGAIAIPGASENPFPKVHSVSQYLNTFGVMIAQRIKNQFQPLFDPATEALSPEILAVNESIKRGAGYSLYDAQLAVAEAHLRCLEREKSTLCIAECGSGKTKIGITALHAYQQKHHRGKCFNVVLCPSHMTRKWVREIEESLPNTFAVAVKSITELQEVYEAYVLDNRTCYIIISKEKARDGYMKRPGAIWNGRRKAFLCPSCHEPVMMDLIDCGSQYKVNADQHFFRRENKKNHQCAHCGSPLWTALVPEQQSEWVKVSGYGFVHRELAYQCLEAVQKKPQILASISQDADVFAVGDIGNEIAFVRENLLFTMRKVPGEYIDTIAIVKSIAPAYTAIADAEAIRKAIIAISVGTDNEPVNLVLSDRQIILHRLGEYSEAVSSVPANISNPTPETGFYYNIQHLCSLFQVVDGRIRLELDDKGMICIKSRNEVYVQTPQRAPAVKKSGKIRDARKAA